MRLIHGKTDVGPEQDRVRLHHVIAGSGPALVLIHGFPQTWRTWRKVLPKLAEHFTVIAPDYRGAGDTSRPVGGYDKKTMAADIHALVCALGFERASIVGHDIGMMVAYAYAASFPEETERLVVMDAYLPGTEVGDEIARHPKLWHLSFHGLRDVPEMLTAGREREYLGYFFRNYSMNMASFPPSELDEYGKVFAAPGAMRAGFELYRALPQDAEDNRVLKRTPLAMPVLAIGGGGSTAGPLLKRTMKEVASDLRAVTIPSSGHFIAEEAPEEFLALTLPFLLGG